MVVYALQYENAFSEFLAYEGKTWGAGHVTFSYLRVGAEAETVDVS